MAISFFYFEDKLTLIFRISDLEFREYESIIISFNQKYNNLFDEYGDFKLHMNHICFILEFMERGNKFMNDKFYDFLLEAKQKNKELFIVGN